MSDPAVFADNFYIEDLILSLRKETTPERFYPLIPYKDLLLRVMQHAGIVYKNDVSDAVAEELASLTDDETARLFTHFLHSFDFNKAKLREILPYEGTDAYPALANLLRLPGVRLRRAELYLSSGVTLETLAGKETGEILSAVRGYIERAHRTESVPFPKEVNCHREAARMILRADRGR